MKFTALIDVAIGLSLIYAAASLFVTIFNEYIESLFALRGKALAKSIVLLFEKSGFEAALKNDPVLAGFFEKDSKYRSYIDPLVTAQVVVSSLLTGVSPADVVTAIEKLPDSGVKSVLLTLAKAGVADVDKLVNGVAVWIDKSLKILSDDYTRNLRLITFAVGLVLAGTCNIDTVATVSTLYNNKDLRDELAATAEQFVRVNPPDEVKRCSALALDAEQKDPKCAPVLSLANAVVGKSAALGKLPFGWPPDWKPQGYGVWAWLLRVLGWVLTAAAVSLGAPFWFDLLTRFLNIRSGIPRPEVTPTTPPTPPPPSPSTASAHP